ncbi:Retrovirus-related Pol polyprotein from transposon TNT 1-94 [Senna tora]|uniref:Retrovirus-related Pol polyprotein from transposon TNT 1-94 n=1 Tax=Senna tora TaxID=362788 RepID=A0A834SDV6_9FABA|nr:Retrovirus-related Pol polyprotein from transposon TNT 1-94 [Senna tora]
MDESIIVSSIIDKLPSSWKDFKKNLKHKKEDISLEQLGNHLRLEEEYRKQDAEKETNVQEKVHMVEEGQSNRTSKKRGKDKDKSKAHDEKGKWNQHKLYVWYGGTRKGQRIVGFLSRGNNGSLCDEREVELKNTILSLDGEEVRVM